MRIVPDPPPGLRPMDPREWMRMWARVIGAASLKNVGAWCAHFADYKTGAEIRPGIPLLMKVCGGMSNKTVGDSLKLMREWGVLWRYAEASKNGVRGNSDIHRLTFPDDISAIPMLGPDWSDPVENPLTTCSHDRWSAPGHLFSRQVVAPNHLSSRQATQPASPLRGDYYPSQSIGLPVLSGHRGRSPRADQTKSGLELVNDTRTGLLALRAVGPRRRRVPAASRENRNRTPRKIQPLHRTPHNRPHIHGHEKSLGKSRLESVLPGKGESTEMTPERAHAEAEKDLARAQAELRHVEAERDKAYGERADLVAYLAACYPSVILEDSAAPDWPIVFVGTPSGQMSWHIARSDIGAFRHVPRTTEPTWDGHSTPEKYRRLAELTRTVATGIYGPQPGADPGDDVCPDCGMRHKHADDDQ